jgi:4-coumarate--CoA ligase
MQFLATHPLVETRDLSSLKIITCGAGVQVAPAELETLLLTHPAVIDAGVIGRPDERAREVPVAYVVGRSTVDPEEINSWVAERVNEYQQLGEIVLLNALIHEPFTLFSK